ncbi:hypothetical protein AAVH_14762, partial [Aphelenchoides avenae]
YAILGLFTQLTMAFFWAIFHLNTSEELRILARPVFPDAIDLLSLSSPICLLVT